MKFLLICNKDFLYWPFNASLKKGQLDGAKKEKKKKKTQKVI